MMNTENNVPLNQGRMVYNKAKGSSAFPGGRSCMPANHMSTPLTMRLKYKHLVWLVLFLVLFFYSWFVTVSFIKTSQVIKGTQL